MTFCHGHFREEYAPLLPLRVLRVEQFLSVFRGLLVVLHFVLQQIVRERRVGVFLVELGLVQDFPTLGLTLLHLVHKRVDEFALGSGAQQRSLRRRRDGRGLDGG